MTTNQQNTMTGTLHPISGPQTAQLDSLLELTETHAAAVNRAYQTTLDQREKVSQYHAKNFLPKLLHKYNPKEFDIKTLENSAKYCAEDHGLSRVKLCETAREFHGEVTGHKWTKQQMSEPCWRSLLPPKVATETKLGELLLRDNPNWRQEDCDNKLEDIKSRLKTVADDPTLGRLPATESDSREVEDVKFAYDDNLFKLHVPKNISQRYNTLISTDGSLALPLNATDIAKWIT